MKKVNKTTVVTVVAVIAAIIFITLIIAISSLGYIAHEQQERQEQLRIGDENSDWADKANERLERQMLNNYYELRDSAMNKNKH